MNTFNRVVIVVLLLVLIPLVSMVFVIPHVILSDAGIWLTSMGEQLWAMSPWMRLGGGILLALLFDLLAIFVIYLEVRRGRKRFIRVQEISGGMATLSIESIVQQLQYRLDPLANVVEVKSTVKAKGNKVDAAVDVTVAPGSNVPEMAARLVEVTRRALTEDLGLQVAHDPQVRMKVAALPPGRKPPAARPIAPPQPVVPEPSSSETVLGEAAERWELPDA